MKYYSCNGDFVIILEQDQPDNCTCTPQKHRVAQQYKIVANKATHTNCIFHYSASLIHGASSHLLKLTNPETTLTPIAKP